MTATETQTTARITKTPGVCGGDACLHGRRIAIWMLVEAHRLGIADDELMESYDPPVSADDLRAAWAYYVSHPDEIDANIWENDLCMFDRAKGEVPLWKLVYARRLGLTDRHIQETFDLPPTDAELAAAWQAAAAHTDEIDEAIRRYRANE